MRDGVRVRVAVDVVDTIITAGLREGDVVLDGVGVLLRVCAEVVTCMAVTRTSLLVYEYRYRNPLEPMAIWPLFAASMVTLHNCTKLLDHE